MNGGFGQQRSHIKGEILLNTFEEETRRTRQCHHAHEFTHAAGVLDVNGVWNEKPGNRASALAASVRINMKLQERGGGVGPKKRPERVINEVHINMKEDDDWVTGDDVFRRSRSW